jgi:hypothetical protein
MCNRVVAIEDGRVAWMGKPADLPAYLPVANRHDHGR